MVIALDCHTDGLRFNPRCRQHHFSIRIAEPTIRVPIAFIFIFSTILPPLY